MEQESMPRVGVGVMIFRDGKILLGKRKASHGEGEYCFPGGHLEYGESFEACARREVREETGMELGDIRFLFLGNTRAYMPKHYIQVSVTADWRSGEAQLMEPEKCEGWEWFDPKALPSPMFKMTAISVQAYLQKFNYRDAVA